MQVIPVIDLRGGLAVHAIAGARSNYRPVNAAGVTNGDLQQLAQFFGARMPTAIYVADLDAIEGSTIQLDGWELISRFSQCPLWIDSGIQDEESVAERFEQVQERQIDCTFVLSSETLSSATSIGHIRQVVSSEKLILSLDRKNGVPLSKKAPLREVDLLLAAEAAGINRVIALELASVGVGRSNAFLDSWTALTSEFSRFHWYLGGGIRGAADLEEAERRGFCGVLAATAILQGSL
jgi:HisA/HisF family protein